MFQHDNSQFFKNCSFNAFFASNATKAKQHPFALSLKIDKVVSRNFGHQKFNILLRLQLQNLDQTLCSKSEQKFIFMTKPQHLNLQQTVANRILITNISNSNNLNKF